MMPDRRDLAALIFAFLVAAGCIRLGVWQLDRLRQRRARNAVLLAARARPPLVLSGTIPVDSARDRRVRARGRYDYGHERFWRPRSYEGVPGVDLVTPLRLPDGSAVLVDRGWVPSPDAYHVDQAAYREGDSAAVVGLAMRAPRALGDVDPATLRDSLPYGLLTFLIQLVPETDSIVGAPAPAPAAERRLVAPPGRPMRWPMPELSNGPHLSYAIQWFSFALISVVGSLALARTRAARGGIPGSGTSGYH
jgi:surfeit locus 1 family protein